MERISSLTCLVVGLVVGLLNEYVAGSFPNSCFLSNGVCRHQVRVVSSCDPGTGSTASEQQDGHSLDNGPNAVEKYLLQSKTEHSKRLNELEEKLKRFDEVQTTPKPTLIPTVETKSVVPNKPSRSVSKKKRSRNSTGFKKDANRKENHLLNRVHKEFSSLRDELGKLKKQLDDTSRTLRNTRMKLNETENENTKMRTQLRHTESKLEEEQGLNYRLRKRLADRENELNTTQSKLKALQRDHKRLKLEQWKLRAEKDDCRKELEQCLLDKELLQRALEQALIRYHDLNLKHENVTLQLNITQEEVITCYKGKTTQFCDFEDELICGFGSGAGDLDWLRWKQATPSAYTGPSLDHTCQNNRGHYMYVEATKRGEGDTATLVSPRYYGYVEQCVEFRYHMHGYHVGTLKVYTIVPDQDAVPMWRAMGNQGDAWSVARIPVPLEEANKGYQVVFEVTIGFGNEGDVAVDDFKVFDGGCFDDENTTKEETENSEGTEK